MYQVAMLTLGLAEENIYVGSFFVESNQSSSGHIQGFTRNGEAVRDCKQKFIVAGTADSDR